MPILLQRDGDRTANRTRQVGFGDELAPSAYGQMVLLPGFAPGRFLGQKGLSLPCMLFQP